MMNDDSYEALITTRIYSIVGNGENQGEQKRMRLISRNRCYYTTPPTHFQVRMQTTVTLSYSPGFFP